MKYGLLIFACFLSVNLFSQAKNDSTTIVQLLKEDYKTMVDWDIEKHMGFCTADYVLIEDGEIWDMQMEAENYKQNKGRELKREDYFDIRFVKVLGNTAYTVYSLKSEITEKGKLTKKHWNESVIFRKEHGQWKIALIHSTPVAVR
jgi:ketosteroid isomerase-like protein